MPTHAHAHAHAHTHTHTHTCTQVCYSKAMAAQREWEGSIGAGTAGQLTVPWLMRAVRTKPHVYRMHAACMPHACRTHAVCTTSLPFYSPIGAPLLGARH